VIRYFKRGRLYGALATRVVAHDPPVLWLPGGTIVARPAFGGRGIREIPFGERFTGSFEPAEQPWQGERHQLAHGQRALVAHGPVR
jgi:hypothetical protein